MRHLSSRLRQRIKTRLGSHQGNGARRAIFFSSFSAGFSGFKPAVEQEPATGGLPAGCPERSCRGQVKKQARRMSTRGIIRPGRNCLTVNGVDSAGVLIDGRDYFRFFYHAARKARNYILISGWQFDSGVSLLRGDDRKEEAGETRFLNFLNSLCEKNPGLKIYILAWNFSYIFILDREWMQERIFSRANPNISFHFDNRHAFAASQHQKFVVIDGYASFVGGMDICASRWDDRRHDPENPYRIDSGRRPYGPYHDVNSYITGPAVEDLTRVFRSRWLDTTGAELELKPPRAAEFFNAAEAGVRLPASTAAVSRTQARSLARLKTPVREILTLYKDAIRSARSLIYIENQYFSSYAVYRALVKKMKSSRTGLQIVLVLPKKEQTVLENIYVGIAQSGLLRSLKRVARRRGHSVGIYYPAVRSKNGGEQPVFIHSKLMVVDDRFLTIGSANTNNRSMGLDTELNLSWEARGKGEKELVASIRRLRVELLSEHTGLNTRAVLEALGNSDGLVDYLDALAHPSASRLRRHRMRRSRLLSRALRFLKLDRVILDPERAVIDENIIAVVSTERESIYKRGVALIKRLVKR